MGKEELKSWSEVVEELKFVSRLRTDKRVNIGSIRQQEFWEGYEQGLRFILKMDRSEEGKE